MLGVVVMTNFISHPLIKPNRIQSRIYQQILFVEATKSNTLIILPTGLGKTVIMVMVCANFLYKNTDQQIIVTAPTRPLVQQHASTLKDMLNLKIDEIIIISGSTPPDKRSELWEHARVAIVTPQTLRNDVVSGIVDLTKVCLFCIDEIHRAVGDDPYVLPVEQYKKLHPEGRVIGFTASPGKKEKLREIVSNAGISNIQYMDADNPQVKPYVHNIIEEWIHIDLPNEIQNVSVQLNTYTKVNLKILKNLKIIKSSRIIKNPKRELIQIPKILNQNRDKIDDNDFFKGMKAYGQLMLVTQASEMLETQGLTILNAYFESKSDELRRTNRGALKRFLTNDQIKVIINDTKELLNKGFIHPKLKKLIQIIEEEISQQNDGKILVFSNYKATINFLVKELNKIKNVTAHRFVGQSSARYGRGLKQSEQKHVLDQFRSGKINLLVSTSVGEEGLDIAQCDLVIFYDVTPSATRLIQRSGRTGRARKGKVIIFITKGTRDEGYFYSSQKQKQKVKVIVEELKNELEEKNRLKKESLSRNASDVSKKIKKGLDLFLDEEDKIFEESKKEESITVVENDITNNNENILFHDSPTKPIIYIDHREKGSGLLRELLNLEIDLRIENLPIGDFILSNRVCVERKTISDFCNTLIRNELFEQLSQLKTEYSKPLLLLEGEDTYNCRLSPASIRGAIAAISIDFDLPIIRTDNYAETALMIQTIARREQKNKSNKPRIHKSSTGSLAEEQLFLISSLPNIDRILAERLLMELKSPREILNSHSDVLRKVHGIGLTKANRIDVLLSTPFDEAAGE